MAGVTFTANQDTVDVSLANWAQGFRLQATIASLVVGTNLIQVERILTSDPLAVDTEAVTSDTSTVESSAISDFRVVIRAVVILDHRQIVEHRRVPISSNLIHESCRVCRFITCTTCPNITIDCDKQEEDSVQD